MEAIRNGIDILVGTPGRIKDHLQNNKLDLSQLKHVVLDEVDQMLDMGFAEQVEEILSSAYNKGKRSRRVPGEPLIIRALDPEDLLIL